MNIWKRKKETSENKIIKSKEIIKTEKQKIKLEKNKIKEEKKQRNKKNNNEKPFETGKAIYTQKDVIITIFISMIIGILISLATICIYLSKKNLINSYKDLNKLVETYNTISNNYYGDLDKEKLIDTAIESMIESVGDTFTTYSDSEKSESFIENVEGTYEGIGCTVSNTTDGQIVVISIFENSPSDIAGLKESDIIIKVDDKDYKEKSSTDVANYIKNSKNDKIKLTILREEVEQEIIVNRKKIEVPVIESEIYEQDNHKIGYISISIFSSVSSTQFKEKLEKLEKENIEGLIIDVRDNAGGYLSSVTDIAELFLKKGQIIYQLEGENKKEVIKDTTKAKRTYPIAVIINKDSASASEILASSIKESYGGLVVGVNSYGKGTVQQTKTLNDGSMIKYTTQNWLTPNGNWINEIGVEPTNIIEADTDKEGDNQLQETLKLIAEKVN